MTDTFKPEAVIYCRVACIDQTATERATAQEKRCRQAAQEQGYEVIAVFADQASGSGLDRPGLRGLLDHVRKNAGTAVIVDDISRLARDTKLYVEIRSELSAVGAALITPEFVYGDDPESRLLESLLAALAQYHDDRECA